MNQHHKVLPLALIALLVACGVSGDSTTDLRPTPPALGPGAQQPQVTEQADVGSGANPWYEHYNLSEVIVRISPDALASAEGAEPRMDTARLRPRPTRAAYSRRLQSLQQVRESLLRENATLTAKLASQAELPTPTQLGALRTQLGRLSAQQRLVMTRTQAVEVEHQALLTMLAQTTATADSSTRN